MNKINQLLNKTFNRSNKTAFILALVLTVASSFTFANGIDDINKQVSTSFKQDFKNARLISSEVHSKFTKLTFKMNDIVLFAFYTDNGQLLAVVRNILSSQLPVDLMTDLKKSYSSYWITELFELNGDGQNCYYVSLENADSKVTLRSNGNEWEVYQEAVKK
jgi:hypothetical protein